MVNQFIKLAFVMVYCTLVIDLFLTLPGIILGHYWGWGFLGWVLGEYWLAELVICLAPLISFGIYLAFFEPKEEFVPMSKIKGWQKIRVHHINEIIKEAR
jgi:hypothetical protein